MFRIAKSFSFSAADWLPNVPPDHKCRALHGHTYTVTFYLESSKLDDQGFVRDFNDLVSIKKLIDGKLDHTCLNDLLPNPSSEHLAHYLYTYTKPTFPDLVCVRVYKSSTSFAEYEEGPQPCA